MDEARENDVRITGEFVEVGGKNYRLKFGNTSVCVYDSYFAENRWERLAVIVAIRDYLSEQGLLMRSASSMEGEWLLHNIAYKMGERKHAKDLDLEYAQDSRWYIAVASKIIGVTGF